MKAFRQSKVVFWICSLPPGIWFIAFFFIPFTTIWIFSFGEKRGLLEIELNWTLGNYLRALDPLYLKVFFKSIYISGIVTFICLIIGFPVALSIIFASSRWKYFLLFMVILPFWTNLLIRTYALIAVLRTRGYVNFGLEWTADTFGLHFEPLGLLYNNTAVIIGLVYVHLPFMILPLYAGLDRFDKTLIEAGLDLGATPFRVCFSLVLPLVMPAILAGVLLVFIPCLGSYLTPDLLGGTDSQMIGNIIERQFKRANDWAFGSALSMLLIYMIVGVLLIRPFFKNVSLNVNSDD